MLLFVVKFISANRHFAWHILYDIKTFIGLSFDIEYCAKFSHIRYYWLDRSVSFYIHDWNNKGSWMYFLYMNICTVLMRASCLLQCLVPCSKDVEGEGKPLRLSNILTLTHIFEDSVASTFRCICSSCI